MRSHRRFSPTKGWRIFAATLLCATAIAAIRPDARAASPTVVNMWSWGPYPPIVVKQMQQALQAQGNQIQINERTIPTATYDSVLQTAMTGGKGPDLLLLHNGSPMQTYAAAGLITPLDGKVDVSHMPGSVFPGASYQGKRFAIPTGLETIVVAYRKDIFARYNLAPPTTWAGFLQICRTLQSKGVTPIYETGLTPWMVSFTINAIAATTVNNDGARALIGRTVKYNASAAYLKSIEQALQLKPYFERNWQAAGAGADSLAAGLGAGRAAMIFDGSWDLGPLQAGPHGKDIGLFLVPPDMAGTQAREFWYVDGDLAVNAHIADPKVAAAALKVARFAATPAYGRILANTGNLPTVLGTSLPTQLSLSQQTLHWFQTTRVEPDFLNTGQSDLPPIASLGSKSSSSATSSAGVWLAEYNETMPLFNGTITPRQMVDKIQQELAWYYK